MTTLITHIFNEEYLLPFWLHHHKDIFDDLIVVDYNSTDKSIEICKGIWPECTIIQSRNQQFDANEVDKEIMDIENNVKGIKMVLNTTEFIFCETTIKDIFDTESSYLIDCVSPYSLKSYTVANNNELFSNLLNDDIRYHKNRFTRQIHKLSNGNYECGRHKTRNASIYSTKAHIVWFGYYPLNDDLLKRKLQISQKMPQEDIRKGLGFQHLFDKNKMLSVNHQYATTGIPLKQINPALYELIRNISH
jgi:hypothetical protein